MKLAARSNRRFTRKRQNTLPMIFQDRLRGKTGDPNSFTATQAKNEFGHILEKAIQGTTVVITKHDAPKAVLMSMDQFNALKHAPELKLKTLGGEFDMLLARMQSAKARTGMKVAFHATPQQMGKAAIAAARKRD